MGGHCFVEVGLLGCGCVTGIRSVVGGCVSVVSGGFALSRSSCERRGWVDR